MNFCWSIEMLGSLRVVQPQRTLTRFGTQKAGALLAFLALRAGRPCPREELIDLFWGDMDLPAGRDNLSTTLGTLRRLLEPPGVPRGGILVADRAAVGLNHGAVSTDVARFERLLGQARSAGGGTGAVDLWGQAVQMYGGDFLPGCYLDWAVREAERLRSLYVGALGAWARGLEDAGATGDALDAARRWACADPYSEEAGGALVRLLARMGRPDAAREAYRDLERTLREEFGTSPSPATRRPVEALLSQPSSPRRAAPGGGGRGAREAAPSPFVDTGGTAPHAAALPASFSRFFGREAEMALMTHLVPASGPWAERARLVTLTGPGGIGKTRLATEFARRCGAGGWPWAGFVPLADLSAADRVLPHIAQTLGLPAAPGSTPLDHIAAFIAAQTGTDERSALLVLDNLEQIPGAGDAVQALLERAPSLTCLCTSRRRLGLRGERLIPLAPLPVPDHEAAPLEAGQTPPGREADPADLLVYPSVRLYVDRAQAVRPDFQITPGNAGAVAGLCRALEGSPLALELAASWVRSLPPRAMWERLSRDLDGGAPGMLEARYDDLPARHRSLWAALDWSFRLLPPTHQRLFARLSVFRGGWTLEDCQAVCDEPDALQLLADLEEASLVRSEETGAVGRRWHILETVRRHAGARLRARAETGLVAGRHLDRFLTLAEHADCDGRTQAQRLAALESEHDNLRAALEHAGEDPDAGERGLRLAAGLLPFWRARSHLREGQERTERLLATPGAARRSAARAAALNCAGTLAMLQADYAAAQACSAEALGISNELSDAPGSADALLGLGNVRFYSQDYPAAQRLFEDCLALRRAGDAAGTASACHGLGSVALRQERYADAARCYERAMRLRRGRGDVLGAAASLGGLGQIAVLRGDYEEADRLTREALALFAEAGQQWVVALCLENLSRSAEAQGRSEQAVRLLGAATALRGRFHFGVPPAERAGYEERLADLRARMGAPAFAAAWDSGRARAWQETVGDAPGG